jgi:erythromycin esterase-like protein
MINWMRAYNLSGQGQIQFTGFDMQYTPMAMQNVHAFVTSADPGYLATLNTAFALATSVANNYNSGISQSNSVVQAATDAVDAVHQYLTDHRSAYLAIQQNPGARIVLWAHDEHMSRAVGYPAAVGQYLAANHGDDYVVFGQIFHAGIYNAYNNEAWGPNNATESFPGTVEYVLHSTSMPRLMLDMRHAQRSHPNSSWLFGTVQYRWISAIPGDGFGFTQQLTTDYDVLIFFDQTTPSELLPSN